MIKENRSTDELFGTFPGVHNFCRGGNSPLRQTTDQSISCTGVGTRSGNGWCESIECVTPDDPEGHCTGGDICPQITTGKQNGSIVNLVLQDPTVSYADLGHTQADFIHELSKGKMNWPSGSGMLTYFGSAQIPYYYTLASTYGLADNHFSTMGGPSLPNHAYMFAASSGEWSDNPSNTATGVNTDPGTHPGFTSSWTCGAKHTGTAAPYTYTGDVPATQASDGTQYYAGVCTNHPGSACTCECATGTKCPFISTCSTDPGCRALSDTCTTAKSIGGTPGAPCLALTTIADQIEAVLGTGSSSWGYYSNSPKWTAPAYFQNIYFSSARWASHVHQDTAFDTDVSACTGMCSNNHSKACTLDAQCGGGTCIDSDGTPAGSQMCSLPKVAYVSPTTNANSDHPGTINGLGPVHIGEVWTQNRLANFFANPYVYHHSILFLTWDDWGGFYDHVPPPVQDNIPSLGFRVPLICVGPYCRNQITHTQLEFASVLKCMESVFGLSSINARDAGAIDACAGTGTLANNSDGMVDLSQNPIPAIGQTLDPTTTSVQSSVNPSTYGQQITFTASVTSAMGAPSGTVTFLNAGSPIGSNSLSQGSASISQSNLPSGANSIVATYGGDPIFGPSTSTVLSQIVNPATSTTTLVSSLNPSYVGQSVTLAATVTSQYGGAVSGNVTFKQGTTTLSTVPLANGQASYTTSFTAAGTFSITATYAGDTSNLSSTSAASQVVNALPAPTTTALTTSGTPSFVGQSVTFTAMVSSPYGPIPDGHPVQFFDGSNTLGSVPTVSGVATYTTSSFSVGSHIIKASFVADPTFASSSQSLTQVVKLYPTTTGISSSLHPSNYGQSVTFTATVTSAYGAIPDGERVTFLSGNATLGSAPLSGGVATFTTSSLKVGSHTIAATYAGDSTFAASTKSVVQVTNPDPTTTMLSSSLNPSNFGQSVTFTATVTSGYGAIPDGEIVTFFNGTNALGSVPLSSGVATYTTSSLTVGSHAIKSSYAGDATFASSSKSLTQVVK